MVQFQILGPVEAFGTGGLVDLGGRRQRAVLARLLVSRNSVVSTDLLLEDVYNGAPPASGPATLQAYVSTLRRLLEPERKPRTPSRLLIGRPPGYLLVAEDVDAQHFAALVDQAERAPDEVALRLCDEALALWRGEPYGEFATEPWARAEVIRLHEVRIAAIRRRAAALIGLGRPHAAIADLEAELEANPMRERLWYLLAMALYRGGRQADALAVLRRARELLADELGLDPGPELRALENDILVQADSLLSDSAAPRPRPACCSGRHVIRSGPRRRCRSGALRRTRY